MANEPIGQRIRKRYQAKGWSRYRFQKETGLAYTTINNWEDPEDPSTPDLPSLQRVATALGCTVAELTGDDVSVSDPAPSRAVGPAEPHIEPDASGDRAEAVLAVMQELQLPHERIAVLRELVKGLAALHGLEQLTKMLRRLYLGWEQEERGKLPAAHQRAEQRLKADAVQGRDRVLEGAKEKGLQPLKPKPKKGR